MKIIALLFLASTFAIAQQPQTQTAPTFAVNAKYVNGVAPGYAPTSGGGLTLNLSSGTANCSGVITTYAGGTLSMTASTTNYVYLNTSASCAPTVKTTTFTLSDIPVATVVTSGPAITGISDVRTMFSASGTLGFPNAINGDNTATPGTASVVTSTNSGSTAGIPAGYECLIAHVFVSGANYNAWAYCQDTSSSWYLYNSGAHLLGSESFSQKMYLNSSGSLGNVANFSATTSLAITGNQSTVSCSTSGQAVFVEPFRGSVDKKVQIHLSACVGTASYTYPVAFTNIPSVYASNNVAASIATSVTATAVTVTGATTTGSLVLEDY